MAKPELPRETVAELDPAADAQRLAAHAKENNSHFVNIALVFVQWLGALVVGGWAAGSCASADSALPWIAGIGLVGALVAGQSAGLALSWVWLILNIPRFWRWLKSPPGTPMPVNRGERVFEIAVCVVAVAVCLFLAVILAAVMTAVSPECRGPGLWLRMLGAAALVSIPTPRLLLSGTVSAER